MKFFKKTYETGVPTMKSITLLFITLTASFTVHSAGINCDTLPEWSNANNDYQVNQPHVFCGEAGNQGRAKGFHATPEDQTPSSYQSSTIVNNPNSAGIYTLKDIELVFHGDNYRKSFSSMFPKHCSQTQINNSIIYSHVNSRGACSNPNWAKCGRNAPASGGEQYCLGINGNQFEIASAALPNNSKKINTGFPIYTP